MRWLASLAIIAAAFAAAILGPLAFSARAPAPAATSSGELVYTQGTYSLVLTELSCEFYEAREPLEAEGVPPAKLAFVRQAGRSTLTCWVRDIGGDVMTMDLAGNTGTIPKEWFKR